MCTSNNPSVSPNHRVVDGRTEYFDGEGWILASQICSHCFEHAMDNDEFFAWADERYSFGVYAGKYCDQCWSRSGFRDATDPDAVFDPADAGECYWEDEY